MGCQKVGGAFGWRFGEKVWPKSLFYRILMMYPPNHFGGWVAGPPERAALALYGPRRMILNVYVDAFN